ncbi:MAG: S9 family peptidase [Candidatus Thorarchaeota archaeon]|jgi:dipeptidyl aminopeptidase/acylaminoacyl peptidase
MADVFDIPDLGLLSLSHDSKSILIFSNKDNVTRVYQVLLSNLEEWNRLTFGKDRVLLGHLSNDDSTFAFAKDSDGDEKHNLYLTDIQSYQSSLLAELDSTMVSGLKWTYDDSHILFSGSTPSSLGLWKYSLKEKTVNLVYETTTMSGMSSVNPKLPLVTYDEMSPSHPGATFVRIIDYSTNDIVDTISLSETSMDGSYQWNKDGNKLLMTTNAPGDETLFIWDRKSSEVVYSKATELGLGVNYQLARWLPEKDVIIYCIKKEGRSKLYIENVLESEDPIEISIPNCCLGGTYYSVYSSLQIDKTNPGIMYIAWSSLSKPAEIVRYELESGSYEVVLSSKPNSFTKKLSSGDFLRYQTFDEWMIPAFEISPSPDSPKLDNDPIIVFLHGGPWWDIADNWGTMGNVIQSYSSAGFRVFCPNFRGSTGYGDKFMLLDMGDLGGGDMKDILAAKEYISKRYPESKKIFVAGASYGGFLTFLILTKHPRAFDAGIAIVGSTDWAEEHKLSTRMGQSFIEQFFGGPPDTNPDLYYDRSPINFIEKLNDPLLIIHRENDARCPIEPIYKFYNKAVDLEKDIEIHVDMEAGHGQQTMEKLREQYTLAIDFMKKHL